MDFFEKEESEVLAWSICLDCHGRGKKRQRLSKNALFNFNKACQEFEANKCLGEAPVRPLGHLNSCSECDGSGLIATKNHPKADLENLPHIAIIGAGIGGVALAVACLHRGIPFSLFERDKSFAARSQGYGLTLQQASKAMKGFGISYLKEGVNSTRHLVHSTDGKIIGEWGMRKWVKPESVTANKRTNIHIARQTLRSVFLNQFNEIDAVQWGHQLIDFKEDKNGKLTLNFDFNGKIKHVKADLIVGADGIRSTVRKLLFKEEIAPLRYLGCIVILGICPMSALENIESDLLDLATVFQTVNGNERIYLMPYSKDTIMWQMSFPMTEFEAKCLSDKGAQALKLEALKRAQWHKPIPEILKATAEKQITGYPVYDRELLDAKSLENCGAVTLLGDAAHPMSPFKGQGANQAILDALSLAREISLTCKPFSNWSEEGIRGRVLTVFEKEMLERSAVKVKDSAEAVKLLHSHHVLHVGDEPRGRGFNKKYEQ